jgi:hypothetical protein
MNNKRYYILLGGPEHLDFFENYEEPSIAEQWFWTVPKAARVYEIAFVYLTAPVSRIAGKLMIVGKPFYNTNEFENPKTQNKWMAEVNAVGYFKPRPELTLQGLRALFPDWGRLSYPRSKTSIPADIVQPFLELIKEAEN